MPDADLNENIGHFIGYMTFAALLLAAALRLPSFIKYRIKTPTRSGSFKTKGYFFLNCQNADKTTEVSTIAKPLREKSDADPVQHGIVGNPRLRAKLFLIKLYETKVPIITALSGLNVGNLSFLIIYMVVLVILALYKNTDDVSLMNFKRLGFVAVSQFPLLFALGIKNLPLTYVLGMGYEKFNFIHRFVGRMIFVFAVVHGALQMRLQNQFAQSIHFQGASLYGLIALSTLAIINLTANKFFRDAFYQTFLVIHILGYLTLIVVLWKHADCTRPFMQASLAILVFDNFFKLLKSRVKRATFTAMPAGLTRIEIRGINDGWRAGQHVFLRVLTGRHIFEKHPFTIANAPNSSTPFGSNDHLVIVAKAAGDFTKRIHKLAGPPQQLKGTAIESPAYSDKATSPPQVVIGELATPTLTGGDPFFTSDVSYNVLVDGPYGTFFTDLTRYPTVLLFAGGSGFTYCMAALEDVIGESVKNGKSLTSHVCVVWTLREPEMIDTFGHSIEETLRIAQAQAVDVKIKLFFTKGGDQTMVQQSFPSANFEFYYSRPDPTELLSETINNKALLSRGGLAVGVCGPTGLVDGVKEAVRNLASERVQQIGGIELHTEKFGW